MDKRPLVNVAVLFILGILGVDKSKSFIIIAIIFIVLYVIVIYVCCEKKKVAIIFLAAYCITLFTSIFITSKEISKRDFSYEFFEDKQDVDFQGKVYKKEDSSNYNKIYIKEVICKDNKDIISIGKIQLYSKEDYDIGSVIVGKMEIIEPKEAKNEGGFDQKDYLESQGIYGLGSICNAKVAKEPKLGIENALYNYRKKVSDYYKNVLPKEEGGILSAICLGERSDMDPDGKELFQKAGLSHILAISGLHISVIGLGLYNIIRAIGGSFALSGVISSLFIYGFGIFTGNAISMQRAVGMFILLVIANILGTCYDMLSSLGLMAIIILAKEPFSLFSASFILSFGAVLGIATVCMPMLKSLDKYIRKSHIKGRLISVFVSGIGLWLATIPMIAYFFNQIPLYVVFLNAILLPLVGLLLITGLLGGVLMMEPILYISHAILYFYEMMADLSLKLPFSLLIVATPKLFLIIMYYAILIAFVIWFSNNQKIRCKAIGFFAAPIVLVFALVFPFQRTFEIDMLDVGQGDAIYIRSKENINFFIDGGSSSEKDVGKYTILSYLKAKGVGSIDYWMISHLDEDHYNGMLDLLMDGYNIKNIVMTKTAKKSNSNIYESIKDACYRNNTNIILVEEKDAICTDSLRLDVLFPYSGMDEEGTNENSMVIMLTYEDFECVFTGDMGTDQEELLLDRTSFKKILEKKDIELLKVAHHGSKNSSSKKWIDMISPEYAIISAGEKSRYGHPHKEVLDILSAAGIEYFCTASSGRLSIKYDDRKTAVETFLKN